MKILKSKFVILGASMCMLLLGAAMSANAHYSGKIYHTPHNHDHGMSYGMFGKHCGHGCYKADHHIMIHKHDMCGKCHKHYKYCDCKKVMKKCDYGCKKVMKKCDYKCKKMIKCNRC